MDLYRFLGVSTAADASDDSAPDGASQPEPWTILTKVVETTDESGVLFMLSHVTP